MNATDLQKLKELAQAATSGPWKRGPYGWVFTDIEPNGYAVACCESKSGYMRNSACNEEFIAAANPAAILELIALAERAVSPAESVQSVDFYDQKLLELLWRWAETHMKRGYTNDNQAEAHASLADFLNAAVTAQEKIAHAKGRRSALEELHPQWLKERCKQEHWQVCPMTGEAQVKEAASATDAVDCQNCDGHGATHYPDGEWKDKCAACKGTGIQQSTQAQATPEGDGDTFKEAYMEWSRKTDWVREEINDGTIGPWALGMHRADVLKRLAGELRQSQQAAEPFAWALLGAGFNCTFEQSRENPWKQDAGAFPLYRAAQPQQVDTSGLPG